MKMKLPMLAVGMLTLGAVASVGMQAFAQTPTTTSATPTVTTSTDTKENHHAPMGGDGIISAISGTTITMAEEADEGNASYTIDASAVTNMSSIKVGDKIFVEGTINGNNVVATSISLGHPGHRNEAPEAKDANGNDIETNDGNN
jgi:hypothetical protein